MYRPIRMSLESLLREFERASAKYPPLYYEQIIPWHRKTLPRTAWDAFVCAINGTKSSWQQFDLFPNLTFCGRFFGDGAGLEEAKRLGESLYLVFCEIDQSLSQEEGYHGFLRILDDMAFNYPTPLLRVKSGIWGKEYEPPLKSSGDVGEDYNIWFDEQVDRWTHSENDGHSYPSNPYVRTLVQNIFTSAIGAIHNVLSPENALLVGDLVGDLPFAHFSTPSTSDSTETCVKLQGIAPETDEKNIYEFQRKGKCRHIRFEKEEGIFDDWEGLKHLARLFASPDKSIEAIELQGNADSPVANEILTPQPAIDEETVRRVEAELENLREQRDQAAQESDHEKVLELDKQIEKGADYLRQGKRRRLGSPSQRETDRKAVGTAIRRAKAKIRQEMPGFGEFLDRCIVANGTAFTYSPYRPAPEWVL